MATSMEALAEQVPAKRGRRPSMKTVADRMERVQETVEAIEQGKKVSQKRANATFVEIAELIQVCDYHAERGEDVSEALGTLKNWRDVIVQAFTSPAGEDDNGGQDEEPAQIDESAVPEVQTNGSTFQSKDDLLNQIRDLREQRQSLVDAINALQVQEESFYAEIGRFEVEQALSGV